MELTKHWAAQLDDYAIDLTWSADTAHLAAASAAGPISIFSAADGTRGATLPGHDNGTNAIDWEAAGTAGNTASLLTSGGQDGAVKFWDPRAGQHTATAKLGPAWVEHVGWRPPAGEVPIFLAAASGRELFFVNRDGSLRHTFKPAPKTISALAWHPGGGAVAAAYFGGVCIWDADDCVAQKEFPYGNGIHALVWSPDGKWLVSGNQDPSVHLWIPETDTELHMSGYEGKVKHLSFDHTSRWLATSGGRDACIWDCSGDGPEGREPAMLPHEAPVCAVCFQKRHGLLATASQDGVVQLWSPERSRPLRATVRMPTAATKLLWSPDDQYLAIGSEKGAVYVLKCVA
jgi:WD40 repeat protein